MCVPQTKRPPDSRPRREREFDGKQNRSETESAYGTARGPPGRQTVDVIVRPVATTDDAQPGPPFGQWGHAIPAAVIGVVLSDWQQTPLAELLVAEIDGTTADMAGVVAIPHLGRRERFARLMGLVVRSTHRRQGVGAV